MDNSYTLVERLQKRAAIRRQITTRKSVQEGKPDRLADLLEEAAWRITTLESYLEGADTECNSVRYRNDDPQ